MSIVTLVSGGLDSTLMALLTNEEGITQYPVFINYGQLSKEMELNSCISNFKKHGLPIPKVMDLRGFGEIIASGLTNANMRVSEDAFLPNRNLLFLLAGSSYAFQTQSNAVAIGLLNEKFHIFPDQTNLFLRKSEELINISTGRHIKILSPLIEFSKSAVIKIASQKGIRDTYSCHTGLSKPCGKCISCLEIQNAIQMNGG